MMVCKKCGNEISENSKFCNNCGCPTNVEPGKSISKVLVLVLLLIVIGLVVLFFMNKKQPNDNYEIPYNVAQTDAEKMIGEWIVVGEIDGYDGTAHYISDGESDSTTMNFNGDGSYVITYNSEESIRYTYEVTSDGYMKSYDYNGEYTDPDYKIKWNNDELILEEYWHNSYYDEGKKEFITDMTGSYDEDEDHDAIILKRKN